VILALLASVLTSEAPPSSGNDLDRFLPCTPGLTIEYRLVDAKTNDKLADVTERIRGAGQEPRTCVTDRTTHYLSGKIDKESLAREYLVEKIMNAGYADQPLAFRPPILKRPLEKGKKWTFDADDYEILETDAKVTVPAGTFDGCLRVEQRERKGAYSAQSVYAPGIGLIRFDQGARKMEAMRTYGARSSEAGPTRGTRAQPVPKRP
jgi:hypothetical protein